MYPTTFKYETSDVISVSYLTIRTKCVTGNHSSYTYLSTKDENLFISNNNSIKELYEFLRLAEKVDTNINAAPFNIPTYTDNPIDILKRMSEL